jgi:hypothetical protein
MKLAGCSEIAYGVESANQKTLNLINKGEGVDDIRRAIVSTKKLGMTVRATLILGLPGEDERDILNTLNFLLDVEPNEVQLYGLAIYAEAGLLGDLESLGVRVLGDGETWDRSIFHPGCETDLLPAAKITELGQRFIDSLVGNGYVYCRSSDTSIKRSLEKVVYTGFCPVQRIPDARNALDKSRDGHR